MNIAISKDLDNWLDVVLVFLTTLNEVTIWKQQQLF
jgi:hypothetical protein